MQPSAPGESVHRRCDLARGRRTSSVESRGSWCLRTHRKALPGQRRGAEPLQREKPVHPGGNEGLGWEQGELRGTRRGGSVEPMGSEGP